MRVPAASCARRVSSISKRGDGGFVNAMSAVLRAGYVRPCTTCKPGPDGSLTGLGWSLAAVGAAVLLLGIGALVVASRSGAGSGADSDAGSDAGADADAAESENSNPNLGGGLVAVGAVAVIFGLIILAFSNSRIEDDKSQLRLAATDLVSVAVDGPNNCRQLSDLESREWASPSASTGFVPVTAHCDGSPRQYAQENTSAPAGVFIPIEYVFSSSFTANGEVTLHDKQDNRSMCVTLPDTDVAAAAQPSPSTDTDSLPAFDDVTVDPSPYVKDGACPDAPVIAPYSP